MQYNQAIIPEICSRIDRLLQCQPRVVAAIDGRCGSGKSSLANQLASFYACDIICMDAFFLPPALRTPARLAVAGGNVHYERFLQEVITPLQRAGPFTYRQFDCAKMDYGGTKQAGGAPLILCEGSYSTHPYFGSPYDIRLFTTCSPQEQKRRILSRNGAEQLVRFEREWIPMEERYFAAYSTVRQCDFVIDTEQGTIEEMLPCILQATRPQP